LRPQVKNVLNETGISIKDDDYLDKVIGLIKDRCTLLNDFAEQGSFFFKAPESYDLLAVQPKWNSAKSAFFSELAGLYSSMENWDAASLDQSFKQLATEKNIKPGELQLPLRIMLVGGKFGPPVFDIAATIGKHETIQRINKALSNF
jgi:glutamyl-tRNA synthetase